MKPKVLYICHNHPTLYPGGAETHALEVYQAMQASGEWEAILMSQVGIFPADRGHAHSGTVFSMVNGDDHQYFFHTGDLSFDYFYLTLRNKEVYCLYFDEFLRAHQPDVVHFQHTLHLGYDLIRQTRNTLPDVPILYTLHEYLPICHRNGQMVRPRDQQNCLEASPRRCHECFPHISPQKFFLRQRFIQSHLSLVDLFIAPSYFLLARYVEWGIPREKIQYEEYGRCYPTSGQLHNHKPLATDRSAVTDRPRNRFGFFGQLTHFKGLIVLLQAMQLLDNTELKLWIYGANLEWQTEEFCNEFTALLEATQQHVTFAGRYQSAHLPALMSTIDWVVVPSIWWENSPLVIQEAFMNQRPVLCSNIGGMAEKVTHGVNGLHFQAGNPSSLAETLHYAASTPGLWETLQQGIPPVYRVEDSVAVLNKTYRMLLEQKATNSSSKA